MLNEREDANESPVIFCMQDSPVEPFCKILEPMVHEDSPRSKLNKQSYLVSFTIYIMNTIIQG